MVDIYTLDRVTQCLKAIFQGFSCFTGRGIQDTLISCNKFHLHVFGIVVVLPVGRGNSVTSVSDVDFDGGEFFTQFPIISSYIVHIFPYIFLYVSLCFAIFCYVFLYFSTTHICMC